MGNTQKKSYSLEATPSKATNNSQKTVSTSLPESTSSQSEIPVVSFDNEPVVIKGIEEGEKLNNVVDAPSRTNAEVDEKREDNT